MGLAAKKISGPPQKKIHLKKGDLLFKEGDGSRSMFFLKSGIIRIFKKKGDSDIEIEMIHSGQVLGELAFLDGNPRSASGEAMSPCELIEISGETFTQTLKIMPEWLKLLLKTIVGRLRTASTRIKQLEIASSAYTYDMDGKGKKTYVYLSNSDILKVASGVLLVASRYGDSADSGLEIRTGILERFANQIMGVPVAKITSVLDVFTQSGITGVDEETGSKIVLKDIAFLDRFISWLNEQNMREEEKKELLTMRQFIMMSLVYKLMDEFPEDNGVVTFNLGEIRNNHLNKRGKPQFELEDFTPLTKYGYCSDLNLKSGDDATATLKRDDFTFAFKCQRVLKAMDATNDSKKSHH